MKRIILFALLVVSSFVMRAQSNFVVTNFDSNNSISLASWITDAWSSTTTDPINASNKVGYFNGDNATSNLSTKGTFTAAHQPTFINALLVQGAVLKCRVYIKSGTFATAEKIKIVFAQNALANAGSYYDPNQIQFLLSPSASDSWITITMPITGVNNKLYDFVQIGTTNTTSTNAEFYIDDIEIATAPAAFSFERAYCSTDGKQIMLKCNHSIVPTTDFTGLSLFADGNSLPIKSVSVDNTDKNLLAISLVDSVLATNAITASYSNGSIQDSSGISLKSFSDTLVANLVGITIIKKWRDDFNNPTDNITKNIGATNPPFTSLTETATGDGIYSVTMDGSVSWNSMLITTFGTGLTDPKQVIDLTGHENIKFRYRMVGNSASTICSLRVDLKDKTTGRTSDQMAFIPLTVSPTWVDVTVNVSKTLRNLYGPITGFVDKGTIYQTSLYFIQKEGFSSNNYNPTNFKGTIEFDYIEIGADDAPAVESIKTVTCIAGTLSSLLTKEEKNANVSLTLQGTIDARDFKTMRDSLPNLQNLDLSGATIIAYSGFKGTDSSAYSNSTNYPANAIPRYAFSNQNNMTGKPGLKSILFPTSLTAIGAGAFMFCSGLQSISIPATITSIGQVPFGGCSASINVSTSNLYYSSIDGVLYSKAQDTLINCPISKIGSFVIPSTVKSLAWSSFLNCSGLNSVTIPNSVIDIQNWAFAYCNGLTAIYVQKPIPLDLPNSSTAFIGVDTNLCYLTVPTGSKTAYQTANVWKSFKQIIEKTQNYNTSYVITDFDSQKNISLASWIISAWSQTEIDPVNPINTVGHFKGDNKTPYLSTKATYSTVNKPLFMNALGATGAVFKCRMYLKSGTLAAGEKLYLFFAHNSLANAGSYYDPNQIKVDITPNQSDAWYDIIVPISGVSDQLYDFVQIGTSSTTTTNAEFYIDDIELGNIPSFTKNRGYSSIDGKSITFVFNNTIDKTSDFSGLNISVDGLPVNISSINTDKNILTINVSDTIKAGKSIKASYSSGNIKDSSGLFLQSFTATVINYYGITRLFGWSDDFNTANDAKLNDLTLGTSFTAIEDITGTGKYQLTGKATTVKWDPILLNVDKQNGKQVLDLTGHETVTIRYKVPSAVSTTLYLRITCKDFVNQRVSDGMAFIALPFTSGSATWTTKTIDLSKTFIQQYDVAGALITPPLIVDRSNIQQLSFNFIQNEGTATNNYIPTIFNGVIDLDYIYVGDTSSVVPAPQITSTTDICNSRAFCSAVDSAKGGTVRWYADQACTTLLATGNSFWYVPVTTLLATYNIYATRTIASYTSTIAVSTVTIASKPTIAMPPPQDTIVVPLYRQSIVLNNGDQNTKWTVSNLPVDSGSQYTFAFPNRANRKNSDTVYTIIAQGQVLCNSYERVYPVKVINYLPFVNPPVDTSIYIQLADTFDVASLHGIAGNGISYGSPNITSQSNNIIDTVKHYIFDPNTYNTKYASLGGGVYTIYILKALKVGIDTLVWSNQSILIIHIGDTVKPPVVCSNMIALLPQDTIVVPMYKQSVVLTAPSQANMYWKTSSGLVVDTAASYSFTLGKKDTTYIVKAFNIVPGCPSTEIVEYPVKVSGYLPFLNTTDTTITMKLGDSVDVAFFDNASYAMNWSIASESNKQAIDTVHTYTMIPPPMIVGAGEKNIYTLKALKAGVDTLVWNQRTLNAITGTKRIIIHSADTACPKYKSEPVREVFVPATANSFKINGLKNLDWYKSSNVTATKTLIDTGSTITVVIPKSDTSFIIWADPKTSKTCPYPYVPFAIRVLNDAPLLNSSDEIYIKLGDSIVLSNLIYNDANPDMSFFIKSESLQGAIDTSAKWTYTPCDELEVNSLNDSVSIINSSVGCGVTGIYSLKAMKVGIDTLVYRNNILTRTIIIHIGNPCNKYPPNPIVQSNFYFNPSDAQILQATVATNCELQWELISKTISGLTYFIDINGIYPSGSPYQIHLDTIGSYNYTVWSTDQGTGCRSSTMTTINIMDPALPSIAGTVQANGKAFSDGIIQLFKQKGTSYTAVSTQNINADGSFNFKWLDATNYLIRALPNDLQSVYLPSYYVNSSDWQTANVINLKGKIIGLHLNLVESQVLSTGTGSISGSVAVADTNFASPLKTFVPIKMSILVMQNGNIVAYALTDANGNYKVDNLPDGTYDIFVEAPGYAKFAKTVSISGGTQASVDFTLKNGVVETAASIETEKDVILYPNPANEKITLQTEKEILLTEVINSEGLIVLKGLGNEKLINVSQLPAGVYTVKMITKTEILTIRFIKQ